MDGQLTKCRCGHHRITHHAAGVDPVRFPPRCDGLYVNPATGALRVENNGRCTCTGFVEPSEAERLVMDLAERFRPLP